jgi:hypothetical protein
VFLKAGSKTSKIEDDYFSEEKIEKSPSKAWIKSL